jgi:eukaryotic-like serine/threonine-protein kinase
MLEPETILQERYRILRQLGQGGMGAVYEAIDLRLDTTVALKETLFVEEKLRRQFEREARLLARLHHPALPRVSDHFAEAEGAFLVMQFIGGDDLAEMITRRRGPFPLEQVLLWADQLLDALDYLHTQDPQIIHRDIKPQNLKLSARGQIILLDFGLAKGQVGEMSRVTTSASIFGYTPNYAPLEQIQGLGTDPRSDIYALAATLYHLLTNVKPPDALSRAAAIVNGQPDPLLPAHEINAAVGSTVAAVLQRAMAQNRDQRYETAAAMRNALQTGNEATVGGRDEAATVLFQSPSAAATRLGVANPTVPVSSGSLSEATVVHASQPPQKKRALPWAVAAGAVVLGIAGVGGFYALERGKTVDVVAAPSPSPTTNSATNSVKSVTVAAPSPASTETSGVKVSGVTGEKEKAQATVKETRKKTDGANTDSAKEEAAERQRDKEQARREAQQAAEDERQARAEEEKNRDETPNAPDTPGYIEVPGRGGRGRRRIPTVTNRTLPDGTKVTVTPNGTRIVTLPNGQTRVIPRPSQRRRQRP